MLFRSYVEPFAELEGAIGPDRFGLLPAALFIGAVSKNSAASEAGVQPNDRMVSIDGHPVRSWFELVGLVAATSTDLTADAKPRPLELVVARDGKALTLQFAPRMIQDLSSPSVRFKPVMGIVQSGAVNLGGGQIHKYYGFLEALRRASVQTVEVFAGTIAVLVQLVTFNRPVQDSLASPVGMTQMAAAAAENGPLAFARLAGMISISLGIVNLLPVPALDGGQILFYAVEGIRGRPLSLALR